MEAVDLVGGAILVLSGQVLLGAGAVRVALLLFPPEQLGPGSLVETPATRRRHLAQRGALPGVARPPRARVVPSAAAATAGWLVLLFPA